MSALIIIPTYNERENLKRLVEDIFALGLNVGILVVDDNSPDGTGEIADELACEQVNVIHREKKLGLGTAYLEGFRYAIERDFDYIFEMDADFSHEPGYLPSFLEKIKGCDLVLGSRYVSGGGAKNWSLRRQLLSKGGNLYARLILGLKIKDLTGGFKCFRREVLEAIDLENINSDGYAFQIEMTYKVSKKGYKIEELPICFAERRAGKSKISRQIFWEALLMVWKLRLGF